MTALGSICTFLNGGTPSRQVARYYQGDVPWITGADISGPRAHSARRFITDEAIRESATNRVPAGTVLLVTRTSVGKVTVAMMDLCFSQDITAIVPDPNFLDTSYLVHFLRTKQTHLERLARGATIKGVTRDVVGKLAIFLPSLPEQQRIVSILDKVDSLLVKRRTALTQLEELTQSIFLDMFGDPDTNPKGWPCSRLGDVTDFYSGSTLPAGDAFDGQEEGYFLLRVSDMNLAGNEVYLESCQRWAAEPGAVSSTCPTASIVIPKRGGAIGTNKKRITVRRSVLDPNLMAIWPRPDLIELSYLYSWLLRIDLASITSGSSIPQLNKRDLAPLSIPVPPLEVQREFSASLGPMEGVIRLHDRALSVCDKLFAALQHRAFRGEL